LRPSADWYASGLYRKKYVARCSAWQMFTIRAHSQASGRSLCPCSSTSRMTQ
jgi:hypothetical protein